MSDAAKRFQELLSFVSPDPSPLLLNHAPDDIRREDEGLCQDSEEQVQVKAVLHQTPSERLPPGAIRAGSRELRDVSHNTSLSLFFPRLILRLASSRAVAD